MCQVQGVQKQTNHSVFFPEAHGLVISIKQKTFFHLITEMWFSSYTSLFLGNSLTLQGPQTPHLQKVGQCTYSQEVANK